MDSGGAAPAAQKVTLCTRQNPISHIANDDSEGTQPGWIVVRLLQLLRRRVCAPDKPPLVIVALV
jgi:hypothetical protein